MQDSTITYKVTASGVEEATAKMEALGAAVQRLTINKNGTVTASGKAASALNEEAKAANNAANGVNRASKAHESYFVHIAKTTVQSALVNKAFLGLTESAGDAVKQVDLFANFPATMAAMGVSTKDSIESLKTLRDYIAGIGGDLTEAATTVTRFTEVTHDVRAATAEFVGVKNALIAGGAGAQVQKNALEQLTQAYSRGLPQLVEWRSLMIAMPLQLSQVAKAMGFPTANALGEAMTQGKVNIQEFMTELTKLATGTGPIAQQAIARMQGIEFATNVMKNTLTNGLAAIYQAIGRQNIISFFNFLTQVIIVLTGWVVTLINYMITLFNLISKVFGGPQLSNFSGEAAGAANSAGDMAGNLEDAADNAKDLKKSLASFDKMNVLPEKTDKGKNSGTGPLDPKTAAELGAIFDDIGGKLQEAGAAAKVFAGILAGLVGLKFAKSILEQFNSVTDTIKNAKDNVGRLKDAFKGAGEEADKAGGKVGQSFGEKIASGIGGGTSKMSTFLSGFFGGLGALLAPSIAVAGTAILGFIDTFILVPAITVIGGLAATLGLPFEAVVVIIAVAIAAIVGIIYLIYTNWDKIWKFIVDVFNASIKFIVATWNTLYDVFAGPINFIWQFIKAIFILIVAIVAIALQTIVEAVVGAVKLIYDLLAAIVGWVNLNVVQPVVAIFVLLWNLVAASAKAAWNFILNTILAPVANFIYGAVIQPILGFFQGLWNGVSGVTIGFVAGILNILAPIGTWIFNNLIAPVGRFFQGLWDGVLNGLRGMAGGIQNIFNSLGGIIKAPINGVIDLINIVLRGVNNIKVPDWVPGLGGQKVNFPLIPRLAKGGIAQQATMAIVGEQGKEAIMPLENNTEWIDELASKINSASGRNNGQPLQVTVQIGEEKIVTKMIDLINEKTQMSGRNAILV